MKLNLVKLCALSVVFSLFIFTIGCKKDQITVDQTKVYAEVIPENTTVDPMIGGWQITLNPDGTADVLPSGDIVYRGTYKINGSKIKIKTEQNSTTYNFEILSETEIKEKEYGTVLKLRN